MLPTFVIIGAMKCGTTSLHYYLAQHPEVCMPQKKETDFFIAQINYGRGPAWYESLFAHPAKACGEASPNYAKTWHFPGVPERMHALLPEARLIYVVRDPVERMVSQYKHFYASGLEHRPLNAALEPAPGECDQTPYFFDSCYHRNLLAFLDRYPLERVLVLSAEDLQTDRETTLRRVFEFVGVDPGFQSPKFERQWHVSDNKFTTRKTLLNRILSRKWLSALRRGVSRSIRPLAPPECQLDAGLRTRLMDRLAPEMREFRRLTGEPFSGWCV